MVTEERNMVVQVFVPFATSQRGKMSGKVELGQVTNDTLRYNILQ